MMIKPRILIWIVIYLFVICCLVLMIPFKVKEEEIKTNIIQTAPKCANILVSSHISTVGEWSSLIQKRFPSHVKISFGLHLSPVSNCRVNMSNATAASVKGSLSISPFEQWSYSYQIVSNLIIVRANDSRCKVLSLKNVYLCIDYIITVCSTVKKQTINGVVVLLLNDLISNQIGSSFYDDFELVFLYHSLVIRYVIGGGIIVVPSSGVSTVRNAICSVLSSVVSQINDIDLSLQSVLLSVRNLVASSARCQRNSPTSLHGVCTKLLHSRKYDLLCFPSLEQYKEVVQVMSGSIKAQRGSTDGVGVYPLLITGLGGSGTHNVANLLNDVGIAMAHEDIDTIGSVSWLYAANDWTLNTKYPYGALDTSKLVPYSGLLVPRFQHVMHLVRHPLLQISSVTSHSNFTYDFILRFVESTVEDPIVVNKFRKARELQSQCVRGESCHLYFAALSWVYWNRHVHSYADGTYSVEDFHNLLQAVCSFVHGGSLNSAAVCVKKADSLIASRKYVNQNYGLWGWFQGNRYHSSKAHKYHQSYTMRDISIIDPNLAVEISHDMVIYGQNNVAT